MNGANMRKIMHWKRAIFLGAVLGGLLGYVMCAVFGSIIDFQTYQETLDYQNRQLAAYMTVGVLAGGCAGLLWAVARSWLGRAKLNAPTEPEVEEEGVWPPPPRQEV